MAWRGANQAHARTAAWVSERRVFPKSRSALARRMTTLRIATLQLERISALEDLERARRDGQSGRWASSGGGARRTWQNVGYRGSEVAAIGRGRFATLAAASELDSYPAEVAANAVVLMDWRGSA